jgi:hypothetical protein
MVTPREPLHRAATLYFSHAGKSVEFRGRMPRIKRTVPKPVVPVIRTRTPAPVQQALLNTIIPSQMGVLSLAVRLFNVRGFGTSATA